MLSPSAAEECLRIAGKPPGTIVRQNPPPARLVLMLHLLPTVAEPIGFQLAARPPHISLSGNLQLTGGFVEDGRTPNPARFDTAWSVDGVPRRLPDGAHLW